MVTTTGVVTSVHVLTVGEVHQEEHVQKEPHEAGGDDHLTVLDLQPAAHHDADVEGRAGGYTRGWCKGLKQRDDNNDGDAMPSYCLQINSSTKK